jgi:hypothetical protein
MKSHVMDQGTDNQRSCRLSSVPYLAVMPRQPGESIPQWMLRLSSTHQHEMIDDDKEEDLKMWRLMQNNPGTVQQLQAALEQHRLSLEHNEQQQHEERASPAPSSISTGESRSSAMSAPTPRRRSTSSNESASAHTLPRAPCEVSIAPSR